MTTSEMLMLRVEASETLRTALGKLSSEPRGNLSKDENFEIAALCLQVAIALRRAASPRS